MVAAVGGSVLGGAAGEGAGSASIDARPVEPGGLSTSAKRREGINNMRPIQKRDFLSCINDGLALPCLRSGVGYSPYVEYT
ncbi:MAG: hypothetical protein WAO55_01465, partial [Candidatus Manganitrophaceae bacterium]